MTESSSSSRPPENLRSAIEIFVEHGKFIQTVIKCHVSDLHLRNDLYHDFFLTLIKRPLPKGLKNTRAYLYRMVCNEINDALRKEKAYRSNLYKHNFEVIRESANSHKYSNHSEIEELTKVFEIVESNLSVHQSNVLKLKFQQKMTNSEIAEKLNVSSASVSVYCSNGLKKLKKIIKTIKHQNKHEQFHKK